MANLYIVATPIGNLEDISQRALRVLESVDYILAEDTRKTIKLLNYFGIKKKIISYHQHSRLVKTEKILGLLKVEKTLALVSDAGTPGLSDPGNKLIEKIVNLLDGEVKVTPIPGPSALTAAVSISGFPMDKFLFLGFPPQKKKRTKFFNNLVNSPYPVVFYESPHRILKTLKELRELFYLSGVQAKICLARELTKYFETIYRGTLDDVIEALEKSGVKGEFVVVLTK
jgi:16S rRNA (cytidine1402-2'-O)-methyltransferase